jgi:hypothetical protein
MNGNGYRILGFAVWHGGRWYLRHRFPSRRALIIGTLAAAVGAGILAVLARRLAG